MKLRHPSVIGVPAAGRADSRPGGPSSVWIVAVALAALLRAPAFGAESVAPAVSGWTVAHRGAILLPDRAPDADGKQVVITGLSGIAWLADDSYVAIMDNSDKLLRFTLRLSQVGKPLAATDVRVVTLSERHDYEDLAVCPDAVGRRLQAAKKPGVPAVGGPFVFLCEEDTPAIRVASLETGELLGTIPLPANLRSRRSNRGNEPLAIDPDFRHLWTANEEALTIDGPPAAVGAGTVVRLTRIPVDAAAADGAGRNGGQPGGVFQAAYPVDAPHPFARVFPGQPLSGLVALVAIGDGAVLAMERSGCPGLPPFANRIYLVDAARATDVAAVDRDLADRRENFVEKRLLWADTLGINLEGLCLGPRLVDGNRALVAIADNGGLGTPNQLVGLGLVAPAVPPEPAVLGTTAAIVAIAVLVGRLSRPRVTGA